MARRFSVETVFKAVDKVSAPITKMQNRVNKFTRSVARGLSRANRALSKFNKGLRKGASLALKVGGVAIVAGITATAFAINKVADSADELAKRTRRLQFPIKEFQEWQFVAEQSGLATGEFDKSIEKFTKGVGEARSGTGTLVTILKKSNPQLLKQITSAKNAADAFGIYIKGLRGTKNQLDKTALATAAFGRTGAKFLNITEQSTKAIAALRKEQRENGVITAKQAKFAEDYNDATNSLTRSLSGLLQNILLPMLPKITELVKRFRSWIVANKELITLNVTRIFKNIKDIVFKLVDSMKVLGNEANVFDKIAKVVNNLANGFLFLFENGKTILKVAGSVVAITLALQTFTTVMLAVNLAMTANPVGLLVVGISALIGVAALLISNWKPVKAFFVDLWGDITNIFTNAFNNIMGIVGKISSAISPIINSVSGIGNSLLSSLGFGDSREGNQNSVTGPQIVSPQDRIANSISEQTTVNKSEVVIKDDTGRAELSKGLLGSGLTLQSSGGL